MATQGTPDSIIRDLLAIVERADTHSSDGGHFAGWNVMAPPLGVCTGHYRPLNDGDVIPDGTGFRVVNRSRVGQCSRRCQEWRTARDVARAYLAAREPVQIPLVEAAS